MKQYLIFTFLIIVGLLQLTGDLLNIPALKAIGAATGASPAPKVFTSHKGFETYSSRFYIEWVDKGGKQNSLQLTPHIYRKIKGPYNRRNAYGATISYAPVLSSNPHTKKMFISASHYAFCKEAAILHELGINQKEILGNVSVRLEPRQILPKNHSWKLIYEINCNE